MKHTACGGWWEIRTDPQNSAYVVVEGAKKRDYGPEDKGPEAEGDLKFLTEEEREKRRTDAFAGFEGKMEEKGLARKNKERVEELYEKSEVWRDPYDVNARLRRDFRVKRKVWKKEERHREGMQEKFSLGMDIVDETEADRMRARLIDFGTSQSNDDGEELSWKPLFAEKDGTQAIEMASKTKKLKSEIAAEKSRQSLQQTLVGNTRAVMDPFLSKESFTPPRVTLGLLKRKREASPEKASQAEPLRRSDKETQLLSAKKPANALYLVGYDSD